jgi:hypothetical protein
LNIFFIPALNGSHLLNEWRCIYEVEWQECTSSSSINGLTGASV